MVSLMTKRVLDMAGVTDETVKVYLNGKRVPIRSFEEYVQYYVVRGASGGAARSPPADPPHPRHVLQGEEAPRCFLNVNDRWQVAVGLSEGAFQQVSFVNSICTFKGGQHVIHVTNQVVNHVLKEVNKGRKAKGMEIKAFHVLPHLSIFVNALIENPAFDSQTKETLNTRSHAFGSTCDLPAAFLKQGEWGWG